MINANHSSYFNHPKTNRISNKNKDKIKVEKKETEKENRRPEHKVALDAIKNDNNKIIIDKKENKENKTMENLEKKESKLKK